MNGGSALWRRGDTACSADLLGPSTHVSQSALPVVVRRDAVAVVPDVDAHLGGDGDFNGQMGGAGMSKNVADGFCEYSFGMLRELVTNSSHRAGHLQGGHDVSILGQVSDHILYLPTKPARTFGRRLQFEDSGADVLDRVLQIISRAVEPVCDLSRIGSSDGAL